MMSENGNEEVSAEMPRYKCHKEVHALKIGSITHTHDSEGKDDINKCTFYPEDESFKAIEIDSGWCYRKVPIDHHNDCGYLVIYADGYRSWSPTKVFEDGYTRL